MNSAIRPRSVCWRSFAALAATATLGLLAQTTGAHAMQHLDMDLDQDQILLGDPISAGTGCPAGTVAAILSPDQQELSILFDNFVAQTDTLARKNVDRKNCNIAVPVTVPQGFSIALFQVDYRGFNSLPHGARSQLAIDYFFAGQRGARSSRTFVGPLNEDYLVSNSVLASSLVWSACGDSTNLRMNVTLNASASFRGENALSTVDSADISSGLVYHIKWRRCGGGMHF